MHDWFQRMNSKIFESPDHGDTIYERTFGESNRQLVSRKESTTIDWRDVEETAKSHPTLQAELDRVIMIYKLSKESIEIPK